MTPAGAVNRLLSDLARQSDSAAVVIVLSDLFQAMQLEIAQIYGVNAVNIDQLAMVLQQKGDEPPEITYLNEANELWIEVARKGVNALNDLRLAGQIPTSEELLGEVKAFIERYRQLAIEC